MKKNITRMSVLPVAVWLCAAGLQAQNQKNDTTLNRTVVVENQYNPQIMDADKINLLPDVEEPKATKKQIEYAATPRPLGSFVYGAMPAYGPQPVQKNAPRSFLNLGYGNNGNVTGELNYLFDMSAADKLNINAAFDGFNFEPDNSEGWKSRFYQSRFAADYAHKFTASELTVNGNFGTQAFNYLPIYAATDKQTNMMGGLEAAFRSVGKQKWQYAVEAGIRYFGRGYLYGADESNSETNLRLKGNLSYGQDNRFGLALDIENASYSYEGLEGNGFIGFTPYYEYLTDYMRLHLGVKVDINTGYESGVKIAPDVTAEFPVADRYLFYVQATGGTLLNDFYRFNSMTPYWGGYAGYDQMENTHVQLDALAGLKANVADNFWLNVFLGYELRNNEIGFFPFVTGDAEPLPYSFLQGKGNNIKVGAAASYQYKDLLDVSLDAVYRGWSTDDNLEPLLYNKPALDLKLDMNLHPVSRLTVNLGYQHRSYSKGEMDAVSNLYAGVDYRFLDFFSLWVKAANLTNADYQYYYGYPAQKIHVMAGASFRF